MSNAISFLDGLVEGMQPGLDKRRRHQYNRDERAYLAAEKRAYEGKIIDDLSTNMANIFADDVESREAVKKTLVNYAGHDSRRLDLLSKEYVKGAKFHFSDAPAKGDIKLGSNFFMSPGLTAEEKKIRDEVNRSSKTFGLITKHKHKYPNQQVPIALLLYADALEGQGLNLNTDKPTAKQEQKALTEVTQNITAYAKFRNKTSSFLKHNGLLYTNPITNIMERKGVNPLEIPKDARLPFQTLDEDTTNLTILGDRGQRVALAKLAKESQQANNPYRPGNPLPIGSQDRSGVDIQQLVKDSNLSSSQYEALQRLVNQIRTKETTQGNRYSHSNRRKIINDLFFSKVPHARKDDVEKLVEALFN